MRTILTLLLAAIVATSCSNNKKPVAPALNVFPVNYKYDTLEGLYSGAYNGSTIYFNLRHVTGRNAVGYSILNGTKRNFSGLMTPSGNGFRFVLKEPGNNPNDGYFDIVIDTIEFKVTGKWEHRNNKDIAARLFVLTKKQKGGYGEYSGSGYYSDNRNTLLFEDNGQCTYQFYPDSSANAQMVTIRGTWSLENNTYTVDWAKDNALGVTRSILAVDSTTDSVCDYSYYYKTINFDNKKLLREDF